MKTIMLWNMLGRSHSACFAACLEILAHPTRLVLGQNASCTFHNRVNFCYRHSVWNDDSTATELKYTHLQMHSSLHFAAVAAAAHMICGNWQSLNFHIVFQDSKLPRSELCSCNLTPQSVKTSCAVCKWLQELNVNDQIIITGQVWVFSSAWIFSSLLHLLLWWTLQSFFSSFK